MAGNEDLVMQYLMQQGGVNQQQQSIAKKQALVNQLRQSTQLPDMLQDKTSRTVKAAHPLSALANIGGQIAGAYKQKGLDTQADNLMGDSRSNLANLQWQMQQRKMEEELARKQAGMGGAGAVPGLMPGGEYPMGTFAE